MKETELAAHIVSWIKGEGWEVFQEVDPGIGNTADIVGKCGDKIWVVECKTTMSLQLLDQAYEWLQLNLAHYVSVAVPEPKRNSRGRKVANLFLEKFGIGKIVVGKHHTPVMVSINPKANRNISKKLVDSLCEEHKTYACAGNPDSRRWTPFKNTCTSLFNLVKKNPGIPLKEAMDSINHHYSCSSTARQAVSYHLRETNAIPYVKAVRDGRKLRLYPKEKE